jgi:hypothetical protein
VDDDEDDDDDEDEDKTADEPDTWLEQLLTLIPVLAEDTE